MSLLCPLGFLLERMDNMYGFGKLSNVYESAKSLPACTAAAANLHHRKPRLEIA
jgi:hypothetical protein